MVDVVDEQMSLFEYRGTIREKILAFKFYRDMCAGRTLAQQMSEFLTQKEVEADGIVPVPIHWKRYMERGYNQSALIAKWIAQEKKIPFHTNNLIKIRQNATQSSLNRNQRKENVRGVYAVRYPHKIREKTILLVDDVYTTGATVNECARVLKENGAKSVVVLTIAYRLENREES